MNTAMCSWICPESIFWSERKSLIFFPSPCPTVGQPACLSGPFNFLLFLFFIIIFFIA